MGLFDRFKKKDDTSTCMHFNEQLQGYVIEIRNIIFVSEDEQDNEYVAKLSVIAENYHDHLDGIIAFMIPDLIGTYGDMDAETVREKLGKPVIDYDNGTVKYFEQTFDDIHVFEFEFLDDAFEDIQYFSIDG